MTTAPKKEKVARVAILVADGFEQVELTTPREALKGAGFAVDIVSPVSGKKVRGFHHADPGDEFPVDVPLGKAQAADYVGLVLPGGVQNPDALRQDAKVLDFVRHFFDAQKPVAAICHGPWTLIEAGVVSGRKLTSYPSIKTDLRNAGAEWTDAAVVVDRGLLTSRRPDDLPGFCKKMIEMFKAGPRLGAVDAATLTKIAELIKDIKVAMLTTIEADGTLRSTPMTTQGNRVDGSLWFFVSLGAHKCQEIAGHKQVHLSYSDPKANRFVSITGRAKVVRDPKKNAELWTPLVKAWFPKGLEDPDLGLLEVEVERAEYWDTPDVSGILGMAKSLLSGRPFGAEEGMHQSIDLDAARKTLPPPAASKPDAAKLAQPKLAQPKSAPAPVTKTKAKSGAAAKAKRRHAVSA